MKKQLILLFLLILIVLTFGIYAAEYTQDYNDGLTRSIADKIYCRQNANCNISLLSVINTTITNENITGNLIVNGNLSVTGNAPYIKKIGDNATGNYTFNNNDYLTIYPTIPLIGNIPAFSINNIESAINISPTTSNFKSFYNYYGSDSGGTTLFFSDTFIIGTPKYSTLSDGYLLWRYTHSQPAFIINWNLTVYGNVTAPNLAYCGNTSNIICMNGFLTANMTPLNDSVKSYVYNGTLYPASNISSLMSNSSNITCTYLSGAWNCAYNGSIGNSSFNQSFTDGIYLKKIMDTAVNLSVNDTFTVTGNITGTNLNIKNGSINIYDDLDPIFRFVNNSDSFSDGNDGVTFMRHDASGAGYSGFMLGTGDRRIVFQTDGGGGTPALVMGYTGGFSMGDAGRTVSADYYGLYLNSFLTVKFSSLTNIADFSTYNIQTKGNISANNGDIADENKLNSNQIQNGNFDLNNKNWTLSSGWTYDSTNHYIKKSAAGTGGAYTNSSNMTTPMIAGKWYLLTYDIPTVTGGSLYPICGGETLTTKTTDDSGSTQTEKFKAKTAGSCGFFPVLTTARFSIDNVILQQISGGDLYVAGNIAADGNLTGKSPYGMFSSNQTFTVAVINTAYPFYFNQTEISYLVNLEGTEKANISFSLPGVYEIILSVVAKSAVAGTRADIWLQQKNSGNTFSNVPRSNTPYQFKSTNAIAVIAVPFQVNATTQDKYRIAYAGDNTGISFPYLGNTAVAPETPSIIMTISRVSDLT